MSNRLKYKAIDLYCGCGAVTEGLKQNGVAVVAAVDNDPVACGTYRLNHPEVHLYEEKIQRVDPWDIRANDLLGEDADILIVCAPCQPFSNQNKKRNGDGRADLILQAVRFAGVLRPRVIFFENVPGLISFQNSSILRELRKGLHEYGYNVGDPVQLNAADFATPQRRNRCVMFASLGELPNAPTPTTPEGERVTVADAIGDLPALRSGERTPDDAMHFARDHQPVALERMIHIPQDGGDRFALPEQLELPCHRGRRGFPDVYGRMWWGRVAPTLTTGCTDVTRGRFMHPRDDRAISLREAARLQTFPDQYVFSGKPQAVARQIGNAVPVQLVVALTPCIKLAVDLQRS